MPAPGKGGLVRSVSDVLSLDWSCFDLSMLKHISMPGGCGLPLIRVQVGSRSMEFTGNDVATAFAEMMETAEKYSGRSRSDPLHVADMADVCYLNGRPITQRLTDRPHKDLNGFVVYNIANLASPSGANDPDMDSCDEGHDGNEQGWNGQEEQAAGGKLKPAAKRRRTLVRSGVTGQPPKQHALRKFFYPREEKLMDSVLQACISAVRDLGPGHTERVYQRQVEMNLCENMIPSILELDMCHFSKTGKPNVIGRLDMEVANCIAVEMKIAKRSQKINYDEDADQLNKYLRCYKSNNRSLKGAVLVYFCDRNVRWFEMDPLGCDITDESDG
mgnify:CR=1 FL=1